jgi:hypothetical protein
MYGIILIGTILIIFLWLNQRNLQRNRRERKWIYGFSLFTLLLSICLVLPVPADRLILFLNETVGAFTHWVIAG